MVIDPKGKEYIWIVGDGTDLITHMNFIYALTEVGYF